MTCQVKMCDGKPCGRALYDGAVCICHSDKADKSRALFQAELNRIIEDRMNKARFDYTGFVFPRNNYSLPQDFDYNCFFQRATFQGEADLSHCTFAGSVIFEETVFESKCSFRGTSFARSVYFHDTRFQDETTFRDAVFSEDGKADFDHVQFDEQVSFFKTTFAGNVDFYNTCFYAAEFTMASFSQLTRFASVHFHTDATFQKTIFDGEVHFRDVRFMGISSFQEACFNGSTEFWRVRFVDLMMAYGAKISGHLIFREAAFGSEAHFSSLYLAETARVGFHTLHLARCRFLDTKVKQMEFIDVHWPIRERLPRRMLSWTGPLYRWLQSRDLLQRKAVRDELDTYEKAGSQIPTIRGTSGSDPPQFELIAQLYRQLQANSIENYRYREAGDFYVGEQEMMRRTERNRVFRLPSYLYQGVAYYGQSYVLPLNWLAFVLLVIPMYMLYDGITLPGDKSEVIYVWSWSLSDLLFIELDYWKAAVANLSLATFNRGDIRLYLDEWYYPGIITLESAILIVLISFLVLALRRAFKRKSF